MKDLQLILIFLFISACIANPQSVKSQPKFNSAQLTADFKFTTWNAEWLTCSTYGPTNEELQINNIVKVIKSMNTDIVALQEVGTSDNYNTIDTLIRRLGNDWDGSLIPSTKDNCGQNEGIVFKKSRVRLVGAALMTDGGSLYDWSYGRFPVLYNVNLLIEGSEIPVSIINIHAKAFGDTESYLHRKNASVSLKALLDGNTFNTKRIVLLGDFNDYLIGTQCSSCSPGDSPYKNFIDDIVNYKGLSSSLYDPLYNSPVIDNIIISNEMFEHYKQNSTIREVQATQNITNYSSTTSDHIPISASFSMKTGIPDCETVSYSETFASSLGDFSAYSINGSQEWIWKQLYGATVTGYASTINNPNEDWLISPSYDLSNKSSATLSFSHALNFSPLQSDIINNHTVWISNNYSEGSPENAIWSQLEIPNMPSGNSWIYINSGDIQFPNQMLQKDVRFAFKYLSTSIMAGTWEIRNLTLNTECESTEVSSVLTHEHKVYVVDKKVIIRNEGSLPIQIFNSTGRVLFSTPSIQNLEFSIEQQGVYLVRLGNKVNKIIIR